MYGFQLVVWEGWKQKNVPLLTFLHRTSLQSPLNQQNSFYSKYPIPFTRCHCSVVNVLASVSFEGFFFVPGEFKNGDKVCPNIFIWSNLPARTHVLTDIFLCTGEQPTWKPSHWSRGAVMMKLSQNARALSSSGWPAWNLSRILCAPVL